VFIRKVSVFLNATLHTQTVSFHLKKNESKISNTAIDFNHSYSEEILQLLKI
jgi:hypothetical protein